MKNYHAKSIKNRFIVWFLYYLFNWLEILNCGVTIITLGFITPRWSWKYLGWAMIKSIDIIQKEGVK